MTFEYDLFVIGGGSGGVRAARVASTGGARVALAEEDRYGGTCVIRGCVPKKLMLFASGYGEAVEFARGYGWRDAEVGDFDWPFFHENLAGELDRLEGIYQRLLDNAGVKRFNQRAVIVGPNEVDLADGQRITAKTILVATGGRAVVPDIALANLAITSNEVFHLETLPKTMLIVGGGYIACEFAGILRGLGVQVSQWYRGDQILRGFDNEARAMISAGMRDRGIDLKTHTNVTKIEQTNSSAPPAGDERGKAGPLRVTATTGEQTTFDQVMFATGRAPNTEALGLEAAGVATGTKGEIIVNEYSQTNVPSIYAIGDVTNRVNLTPVAIREAMAFVSTINGDPSPVDHALIPSAVFTQPEFATVGLSEEDAAAQEAIDVYATTFAPMRASFIGQTHNVMFKLIVSRASNKVLGCHIVAPEAGEMIQLAGIAVKMGATKKDFDRVCAVHPTMAEELVTMKTPSRST